MLSREFDMLVIVHATAFVSIHMTCSANILSRDDDNAPYIALIILAKLHLFNAAYLGSRQGQYGTSSLTGSKSEGAA